MTAVHSDKSVDLTGGQRLTPRAFSLLEALVASSILMVLLGVAFSFMRTQMAFGNQAQRQAFGNAEAQRVFNETTRILRTAVVEHTSSTYVTTAVEYFATIKLRPIQDPAYVVNGDELLLDVADSSASLEVVDSTGTVVGQSYDSLANGNDAATLQLRLGDGSVRVISRQIARFRVRNLGDYLQVELALKIPLGTQEGGVAAVVSPLPVASGDVAVVEYDSNSMQ
ncbi:MAG TPA: hypothetical protein DEA08_29990 [Planctomycetes bacterium]|nr:hypothetical protein [Planctomycetota bacterium]|tara:strand:+ start:67 stop:741 length:675 start_codon:yes stop_codon:yes gene_type:complete